MNQADYVHLTLTNSDGRRASEMNVHHTKLADQILGWLGQQAAGEVTVKASTSFGTIAQIDPDIG